MSKKIFLSKGVTRRIKLISGRCPNVNMYVVGAKNPFPLFSRVKSGENWPAEFRHGHFVIRGAGGGGSRVGRGRHCIHPSCSVVRAARASILRTAASGKPACTCISTLPRPLVPRFWSNMELRSAQISRNTCQTFANFSETRQRLSTSWAPHAQQSLEGASALRAPCGRQ